MIDSNNIELFIHIKQPKNAAYQLSSLLVVFIGRTVANPHAPWTPAKVELFSQPPATEMSDLNGKTTGSKSAFNAKLITLKAQKKLACSFPNQAKKFFLDDITSHLLDSIYAAILHFSQSKQRAEFMVKQLIKLNIKLSIIYSNGCLTKAQEDDMMGCREIVREAAVCFIRHTQRLPSSSGRQSLVQIQTAVKSAGAFAQCIAEKHLTSKTVTKLLDVVLFFSNEAFLTAILSRKEPYQALAADIAEDLQESLDRGFL